MSEQLLVRLKKPDRTNLGKCIHLYDETQGSNETQALSTKNCLRQVQEKQIIIKEEGSKEDEQEEANVKKKKVKNGYADLKRHQNDENQEDF